jgi:hypothetical protein
LATWSKTKQSKSSGEGGGPSSGEVSDGLTVLKAIEEEEGRARAKRGPPSTSQSHWHLPTKQTEPGSKALWWKFQFHYYNRYMLVGFFPMEFSDSHPFLRPSGTRTVE